MNKKIKSIIICVLIAFDYMLLYYGTGKLTSSITELSNNLYLSYIIWYIIMSIFLIGIINFVTGLYSGITSENELLPIIQIVFFIVAILIGTGFTEEVLCRGIIQNILYNTFGKNNKVGILSSIIITSVIFGSAHIINVFSISASIKSVLTQMIVTCAIGLYFGAIYARCNNIWSTIFLRSFTDFSIMIKNGFWGEDNITSIINTYDLKYTLIPFIIYTFVFFYLKRKNKIKECSN